VLPLYHVKHVSFGPAISARFPNRRDRALFSVGAYFKYSHCFAAVAKKSRRFSKTITIDVPHHFGLATYFDVDPDFTFRARGLPEKLNMKICVMTKP
jgi:hypothetical protein